MNTKQTPEAAPGLAGFREKYQAGHAQVVTTTMTADLETPVSSYLKLCGAEKYGFLLESVQDGETRGRFSIIGIRPDLIYRVRNGKAEINHDPMNKAADFHPAADDALTSLRHIVNEIRMDLPDHLPPMATGLFGYMAYDMIRHLEDLPSDKETLLETPESLFIRPTLLAVFDDVTHSLHLVTPVFPDAKSPEQAYAEATARLDEGYQRLMKALPLDPPPVAQNFSAPTSNISQDAYYEMVNKARDYVIQGDVFQVVLSQRFETDFPLPAFDLYRSLRRVNPSPYLFFLNFDDFAVVGSSPEVLVGVSNNVVNIRPIAGTRRRGSSAVEDAQIAEDLLADEKERAEHLMLLDLGRNDVGRVSEISTVNVTEAFQIQKTSHLIHIVSNVTGQLADGLDCVDALMAGFPAGTVSGAPKIRAMEIIDELEPDKRGLYAGCVGYFSADGGMDTCITLRTGIVKNGKLYVQAGGGVVYDSTPEYEYQETVNKAAALFRAAENILNQNTGRG